MRVARTAAVAGSLRLSRLSACRLQTSYNSVSSRAISTSLLRSAASQAVHAVPYPEQSVPTERDIDARKTAQDGESRFKDYLKTQPPHTIVTNPDRAQEKGAYLLAQPYVFDTTSNLTDAIISHLGRNLYAEQNHPIAITRRLIESVFAYPTFKNHVASNPVVTCFDNFDRLEIPPDHPGRSRTDTYYVDSSHVLRTHSSAHQHAAFKYMSQNPEIGYTVVADVYRRDSIDRSHFPVFHQMEGARMWQLPAKRSKQAAQDARIAQVQADLEALPKTDLEVDNTIGSFNDTTNPVQSVHDAREIDLVAQHLKRSLEQLVQKVFTAAQAALPADVPRTPLQVRWIEAYFPFTSPSFELEVQYQGQWLELLGCGVTKQTILDKAGLKDRVGWAWGIGIERLAMLLFNIPDIRLFWSKDERFLRQFEQGRISRFEPYSKHPSCYKDISFWLNPSPSAASPMSAQSDNSSGLAKAAGGDSTQASPAETQPAAFHENDIMEIVRDVAGTLVEDVMLVDEFVSPKTAKKSLCYRVNYRSHERTLTNQEVDELHAKVVSRMAELPVEIR